MGLPKTFIMNRIKYYGHLLLGVLIVMNTSCITSNEKNISSVNIDFLSEYIHTSTFLDEQKFIKLETFPTDAVIKNIDRALFSKNKLFIIDRSSNKIIAFDEKGHYLCSTSNLIGRGKDEYVRLLDAAIDNQEKRLYVYCDVPHQMMILDYNLQLIDCIKIDALFSEFSIDNSYLYALCPDLQKETRHELRCYRKDNLSNGHYVLIEQNKAIARAGGLGKAINKSGNKVYVSMPFDNTIYELSGGEITDIWKLNFSDKWFNYENSKKLKGSKFIDANGDYNWCIQNICASDSLLLFNTNKSTIYEALLANGIAFGFRGIINDSIPFSNSLFLPTDGLKNAIGFSISAENILQYREYYREREQELPSSPINSIIESFNEADNPLIIIGTIK